MKRKQFLLTCTMVLLGLFAGVNTALAVEISTLIGNPSSWFYVQLEAGISTPDCGVTNPDDISVPGRIKLSYRDIHHDLVPTTKEGAIAAQPETPINNNELYALWEQEFNLGFAAAKSGEERATNRNTVTGNDNAQGYYNQGYTWFSNTDKNRQLNEENPIDWTSKTASLMGYTVFRMPGADSVEIQSLMYSSYVYFFGQVKENDGWYFTGWSYTEGASDLGGAIDTDTPEDIGMLFKILPSEKGGYDNATSQNVYATFQPVRVSDYKVNGLINTSVSTSTTVVFDVVGERVSADDFTASVEHATDGDSDDNWSVEIDEACCPGNKVTVTVTYTGTADGEYRGNVTLASKSGCSELTAAVYARVGADGSSEATLYDGKTPTATSGTLADMIDEANNTDYIVVLNKNIETATTINANATINFNGYTIGNTLTVSGGEVTIAYSKYGGGADALSVTGGKLILNGADFGSLTVGANGTVEQNGATITGASTNNGTLLTTEGVFEAGLTTSGTLTVNGGKFEGETAIAVSGGTATINKGIVSGTTYGIYVTGGTTNVAGKLAAVYGATNAVRQTSGTVNLTNGKFDGETPLAGTINLQAGFFKKEVSVPAGKDKLNVLAGVEFNEGYRYFIGTREAAKESGVGVCKIGTTPYTTLEDALAYANNNPKSEVTIIMLNDYTLPAGYYTLPELATLIVPMSMEQETGYEIVPRIASTSGSPRPYVQPYPYLTLTMADGVNMDVYGLIEVSGSQRATDGSYAAHPHGPCGFIQMQEGSRMTMQGGSELRAWGFIIGKGETDVRRDAIVREQFQMGDWKGGSTSFGMLSRPEHVFPLTHYYIQNIESPFKYHPGAVLSTTTAVSATYQGIALTASANDIKVIGVNKRDQAIFLMDNEADAENTWVRKWYDVEHDLQVYDVNNSAHIGSMVLDLGKLGTEPLQMNSGYFVLPITCNFKIHLLSGTMDFTQNTALLPGAEVEIDKEAIVTVVKNDDPSVESGSLYIYDADQWDKYAYDESGIKYTKAVQYAAGFGGQPTARAEQFNDKTKLKDATINVHGSFVISEENCYLYTSESGANIFSTNEDAGTFMFLTDGPEVGKTQQVWQVKNRDDYNDGDYFVPAKLRNGDGTYESTADIDANHSFCYQNDWWKTMEIDEDNSCFMVDNHGTFYAKPADYVAIVASKDDRIITGNADHTYSDKAGTGRLFILMSACQWWEVEKKDNLYHCIHPNNDTYYYWDDSELAWVEKTYTITWKNWDGEVIMTIDKEGEETKSYVVTYGTMAEYLGTNPTREANIDYTYDFTGWSPALGPVTSDVTYTATYAQKDRMYTIIFNQEGGVEIERQFLKHNDVPVCENTPTKIGHTLVWSPAIAAVTGDAIYTATWLENPPTEYEVTFFDYDGETVLQRSNVDVGEMPEYTEDTPSGKPETDEFTYVFDHWSPALEAVSATSIKSYTAVYREVAKTYTVIFQNENGSEIERHEYAYGETPVCSATPTKENTAQYTYSFAWDPQIETVMEDATYRAVFTPTTNKYTITLKSNLSGVCTFTGAGTFDYGTEITNVAVSYNGEKYKFDGWSDGYDDEDPATTTPPTTRTIIVTEDITLTANFTPKALTDKTVANDETWEVEEDTEVKDLIITSDGSACGQLLNPENLTIRGEAIYRLQQSFAAGQWYAVAVPWRVEPSTGIYGASGRLASGSQIYIIEFDGEAYANVGGTADTYQYWKFLHETGGEMVPGKLYMIYLAAGQSQLNFHKKVGAALQTRNLTVSTASGSAGSQFESWNAIANPALYTADLSTGAAKYQTYDNNGAQSYTVVDASTSNLIVAKPIFVQVTTPSTVYATVHSGGAGAPAYRRAQQAENESKFVVEIACNGKMADRLIVETADEKENKYVIGQDLAKFGVSSKVAQMWVNRYDAKLCANTVEMTDERADYPLSIFAPAAGEYGISCQPSVFSDQIALYLTYNGEAIWNLSDAPYTLSLQKGNTAEYGLRISVRKAPEIVTGIDEAVVEAQGDIRKVLVNDQVFIIRGEKVYTIDGQIVK